MRFNRPNNGYGGFNSGLNGVGNYLQKEERFRTVGKDANKFFSKVGELMISYLESKELPFKNNKKYSSMHFNANVIQNDFGSFKKWIEENKNLTFKEI